MSRRDLGTSGVGTVDIGIGGCLCGVGGVDTSSGRGILLLTSFFSCDELKMLLLLLLLSLLLLLLSLLLMVVALFVDDSCDCSDDCFMCVEVFATDSCGMRFIFP